MADVGTGPGTGTTAGGEPATRDERDAREPVDARLGSHAREGLTGTAPASVYDAALDPELVTRAPDGRPMDEQPAWRQDFPVDVPQDNYIARRDFTRFLVLTSLAFTCGQYWILAKDRLTSDGAGPLAPKRIASLASLAEGSTTVFSYPDEHDRCILVRVAGDLLVAYRQECTHLACAVVPRPAEGTIHCPCHEGLFDLRTGRVLAGPPPRPLPRITLEIRGGEVWATGIEWRTV